MCTSSGRSMEGESREQKRGAREPCTHSSAKTMSQIYLKTQLICLCGCGLLMVICFVTCFDAVFRRTNFRQFLESRGSILFPKQSICVHSSEFQCVWVRFFFFFGSRSKKNLKLIRTHKQRIRMFYIRLNPYVSNHRSRAQNGENEAFRLIHFCRRRCLRQSIRTHLI